MSSRTFYRSAYLIAFIIGGFFLFNPHRSAAQDYIEIFQELNGLLQNVKGASIYDINLYDKSTVVQQTVAPGGLYRDLKSPRYSEPVQYEFMFTWFDGWKVKWGRKNVGDKDGVTVSEILLLFDKSAESKVDGKDCCDDNKRAFYFLSTEADKAFKLFESLQKFM